MAEQKPDPDRMTLSTKRSVAYRLGMDDAGLLNAGKAIRPKRSKPMRSVRATASDEAMAARPSTSALPRKITRRDGGAGAETQS